MRLSRYLGRSRISLQYLVRSIHSTPRPNKCPNCAAILPSLLPACTNCWHISHLPSNTRLHDIFGLPYHPNPFAIDVVTLKQKFREAQAICHPDSWASRGSNKQDVAQALSSRINEAYQRLLRPLPRAEYLLECHQHPISEGDQVDNMEFMSEIMQTRETIEEAVDKDVIESLIDENRAKMQETVKELEALVGQEQWERVKEAAVRLRYLEGIDRAAKRWSDG